MQTNTANNKVEQQQPPRNNGFIKGETHDFRITTKLAREYRDLGQMGMTSKQLFEKIMRVLKRHPDIIEEIKREEE